MLSRGKNRPGSAKVERSTRAAERGGARRAELLRPMSAKLRRPSSAPLVREEAANVQPFLAAPRRPGTAMAHFSRFEVRSLKKKYLCVNHGVCGMGLP